MNSLAALQRALARAPHSDRDTGTAQPIASTSLDGLQSIAHEHSAAANACVQLHWLPSDARRTRLHDARLEADTSRTDVALKTIRRSAADSLVELLGSLPVRVAVAVIRLMRRILDAMGVPIIPGRATEQALLELQAATQDLDGSSDRPPSYDQATKPDVPPRKRSSRWALPRLRPRTNDKSLEVVKEPEAVSSRRSSVSSVGSDMTVGTKASVATTAKKQPVNNALKVLQRPKILVLDLDETLIHSTNRVGGLPSLNRRWWGPRKVDVKAIEVVVDGRVVVYTVYQRPWVSHFLSKVSTWYTLVIFTASLKEYADPVIDWLDEGRGIFARRLFRESCVLDNGNYVKDLSILNIDLSRILLLDNSPSSYKLNPANGVPVEGFVDDINDSALLDLPALLLGREACHCASGLLNMITITLLSMCNRCCCIGVKVTFRERHSHGATSLPPLLCSIHLSSDLICVTASRTSVSHRVS